MDNIIKAGKYIFEGFWSEKKQENDYFETESLGAEFSVSHVLNKKRD
mgnify:CR=1 FL=1